MEPTNLENLFAKASRINESKAGYHTLEEWDSMRKLDGARRFKERVFGLFGRVRVKSLNEIAELLYQTGIVSSVKEGRKITPQLYNRELIYGYKGLICRAPKRIHFEKVQDSKRQEASRLYITTPHPDSYS